MEVDEIQAHGCKFPRISNGRVDSRRIGRKGERNPDDEEDGDVKRGGGGGRDVGGGGMSVGRLCGWPSSRIVRVSRASGGKDRHSKVLTSRGLRDRRVRLSVTTAIQFYDLQDRLGLDQPSKAVEWLLKAAAGSIAELPSINSPFVDSPRQLSDEKRSSAGTENGAFDSAADLDLDGDPNYGQHNQHPLSKPACSSTSETSKGSGLSLSRSESRIKARERARGRAAEKEKEKENVLNSDSSLTQLLINGMTTTVSDNSSPTPNESNLFQKSPRQWSSAPMNYFSTGLLGPPSSSRTPTEFPSQIPHLGNSLPQFNIAGDHHHHSDLLQHFSFVPDHLVVPAGGSIDYNLNFTISSPRALAGFNRGTLQSNSPSLLPHLQRFSAIDPSNVPFIIGTSTPNPDNHHHHHPQQHHQFPAGLQLCYGDGNRNSDQKGKGKN